MNEFDGEFEKASKGTPGKAGAGGQSGPGSGQTGPGIGQPSAAGGQPGAVGCAGGPDGLGGPSAPAGQHPRAPSMPPPLPDWMQVEDAVAFSRGDYAGVLRRPQRTIEYILGSRRRLARSVWEGEAPWRLAAMLLAVSLLAAIPYGLVSPRGSWWKIAALYGGSLAICFPSLHVFAQFFGVKLELVRSLALSMIITATAALFTFGFFPVIWFLTFSIAPTESTFIGPAQLSTFLLCVSLGLGLVQVVRCLIDPGYRRAQQSPSLGLLLALWLPLLLFILYRMALLLELL